MQLQLQRGTTPSKRGIPYNLLKPAGHCAGSFQRFLTVCNTSNNRKINSRQQRAAISTTTEPAVGASDTLPSTSTSGRSHETDYVVIGSGIGGLCCAALLAKYGYQVTVLESHYLPGGAAHSFDYQGYQFDAGPSFFAGLSHPPASQGQGTSSNPLKQVLDAVGERVDCVTYNQWIVYEPQGTYACVADGQRYRDNILKQGGPEALQQWLALEREMAPLQRGASLFPAAAIRSDLGIILTAARFGPQLAMTGLMADKLTGPFADIVDKVVTNPWLRKFLDLECFVLSGMLAKDTICAEMAFMFMERNSGRSTIDYPLGGSKAIIDALVRGITKYGGQVQLRSHVDQILMEGGRAAGVVLRPRAESGRQREVLRARKAVISNASVWDTINLLPQGAAPAGWAFECMQTPRTGSFMHLHLGINAEGLPADLDCHHLVVDCRDVEALERDCNMGQSDLLQWYTDGRVVVQVVNSWDDIESPQNVCIASIPTVFDPTLAPRGKAVVHAYTAGNEPYELWEGLQRGSKEYEQLKEERSQCLWQALERIIPDIRQRTELQLVGTPLTHQRFLRRYKGTYGPAISAASGTFPGPQTPVPGLFRCGDSCMPGIGVPAAAASGMITANTMAPVFSHIKLLNALNI